MSDINDKQIQTINIEDEMRQSYLDYAMSVIVGRALPDVRDGLKPVHRRVLFAMSEINNAYNRPYLKSARIVGDVIGKYHPHGDSAVYETIVRMAQDFSLRYLLVDGQGNFGSVDGDSAAAMRYTEIRMQRMAHQLMEDLEKDTVDFVPNYDGTLQIPEVFPTRIPNLLVNGSSGIAVGMATNIPPHNLNEVIDGCLAVIDNPEITIDELIEFIPGPDFPTGAIINGRAGIIQAYRTGRGRIYIRAKADIEENKKGKQTIIVHELPYQLNKARLIEKIADLVKEKKIEGISELRDESDKDGMRIVIEIRRDAVGEVVLNNLYAQTQLQNVFGINIVALVAGQPKLLNLKQLLTAFVTHRREVVTRRTVYLLRKAREKGHILEGQAVALSNIDEVIALIKASASPADAKDALLERAWASAVVIDMLQRAGDIHCRPDELEEIYGLSEGKYYLSPGQAQSILEMRLNRLTSMEQDKLLTDYSEVLEHIAEYTEILGNSERLLTIIREELAEVKENFGDERRSEIVSSQLDLTMEDLITEEDLVVTISHGGYAKTQPISAYQAQRRGGTGKTATSVKDEDFVEQLLVANSHDTILCFSNLGKVYWLRVFHIPQAGRNSRGRPMVNLLNLDEGERVTSILPVSEYSADKFIFMATAKGTVKKTPLTDFSRPRSVGLRAVELNDDDTLVGTAITTGDSDIMLVSSSGKALRFKESDVRAMGRTARGVRGMRIADGQSVIALIIPEQNGMVLSASQRGYGKRTLIEDFPVYGRGGQGVIAMQTSDRNGPLVGAKQVFDGDEIMLISDKGTLVRTHTEQISVLGRNTQGVTLIKLRGEENLVGLERLDEPEAPEENEASDEATEVDSATANSPEVESSETDSSETEQSSDGAEADDAGDADDAPEDKQD